MVKIDPELESVCKLVTQCHTGGGKSNFDYFLHKKDKTMYLSHKLLLLLQTC